MTFAIEWLTTTDGRSVIAPPASAVLIGVAGSGKSTAAHLWLSRLLARGGQVVILNGSYSATPWLEQTALARGQSVSTRVVTADTAADDMPPLIHDLTIYDAHLPHGPRESWYTHALEALAAHRQQTAPHPRPCIVLLDNTHHPNFGGCAAALRATVAWAAMQMHCWFVAQSIDELANDGLLDLWQHAGFRALFRQSRYSLMDVPPSLHAEIAEITACAPPPESLTGMALGGVVMQRTGQPAAWGRIVPHLMERRLFCACADD